MSNLVIVEHDNNEIAAATLHTITAAQQIGGDIDLLIAGENCQAVADAAAQIAGVSTVKVADNAIFAHHQAENLATLCWYHHHVVVHGMGYRIDPTAPAQRKRFLPP